MLYSNYLTFLPLAYHLNAQEGTFIELTDRDMDYIRATMSVDFIDVFFDVPQMFVERISGEYIFGDVCAATVETNS